MKRIVIIAAITLGSLSACGDNSTVKPVQSNVAAPGYASCAEAHKDGAYNLSASDNPRIQDRNHDGIVC